MAAIASESNRSSEIDADLLFNDARRAVFVQVDRLFAGLMVTQWVAGIIAALVISPRTWAGSTSQVHVHVWAAIFVGGAISALPIFLALVHPGETFTRYVIAIGQMLTSALLIHLTGGRIETHFHVFGSLAFLSLYRDWKVLIPATVVVAMDHLLRGIYFPQSVYGVLYASPWRTFEHAGWVIFEDVILIGACVNSTREMRRIAEKTAQIRQSESRTRQIIATALDAVVLISERGRILDWNSQATQTFGWSAEEVIGRDVAEILVPPVRSNSQKSGLSQLLKFENGNFSSGRVETTAMRKDGVEIPVEIALAASRVGHEHQFSAFIRDISQRKQHMEDLQRAKEAAEGASRSKSAFLANMSHEIRTPMSAILGYADLLLEPSRSQSDKNDSVLVIRRNARHLLQLINDILDISKIEADKMSTEQVASDLPQIIGEVASIMRPRAVEKNLDFRLVFDGPIPRNISTDSLRLKQILTNLLGNSIKFTLRGMITLRVSCQSRGDESVVQFDVADTGVGMTVEQTQRIFHAFTQADESTTRKFGGTGLGLVISKRLALLLGGDITVESTPMVGSIFRVFIKAGSLEGVEMIKDAGESMTTTARKDDQPNSERIRLGGKILLAEDGQDNQILLSLHLREAGAEVTVAENGRAAVNLVRTQPFDVVLMDMQMPELDGYGATRELRQQNFKLPIVALTAHAMSGDREKCIAAGCTDYLTKPVDRNDLLRMVKKYLPKTAAPAVAPAPVAAPVSAEPADKPRRIVSPAALASFVDRLPTRVDSIAQYLENGNLSELQRLVHQLKGVGSSYGFPEITATAGVAERQIMAEAELDQIKSTVDELVSFIRGIDGYSREKEKQEKENHATARADHR